MNTIQQYKLLAQKIKLFLSSLFFVALLVSQTYAQSKISTRESLESMKVAFITQKLNLTPDEAKLFWPVYNQYETELEALRKNRKAEKNLVIDDVSNMTDADVEKAADGEIIFRQQELDIIKKYHIQFKKVLPIKKVALLYKAQDGYKKELLKKIQERARNN